MPYYLQTDLVITDCYLEDITGCVMVIHMDQHDRLMEGLLHVYFVDSLYEPMSLRLVTKSFNFHVRSSSDLHRNSIPGFVSHPELQYTHLVKVSELQSTIDGQKQADAELPISNYTGYVRAPLSWKTWEPDIDYLKSLARHRSTHHGQIATSKYWCTSLSDIIQEDVGLKPKQADTYIPHGVS
jgi:hypothetical protein